MKKYFMVIALVAFAATGCGKNKAAAEAAAVMAEMEANANSTAEALTKADSAKQATAAVTKYGETMKSLQTKAMAIQGDTKGEMPAEVKEAKGKVEAATMKVTQAFVEAGVKYKKDKDFMAAMKAIGMDSMVP